MVWKLNQWFGWGMFPSPGRWDSRHNWDSRGSHWNTLRMFAVTESTFVAIVALHRLYQRTCKSCGYHWTVTRAQKQMMVRQPPLRVRARSARRLYLVEAQMRIVKQFRDCAKCGGVRLSERPVTKRHPADPPV